ncbi:chloride channel protein [Phaeobacter sp. PT47_59]|uniref:chloride channel protein n=1 Tax=Phaeobacter sp. PT47_59 TaxID=3029979 RepID=UPI002380752E|nr:chloride channel protein [Phaeobacter sp. PT47_59]MDE4173945.1 chloride channel protein [Phaeobacter sp. PT47_59]
MAPNSQIGPKALALQGLAWLRDIWRILLHRGPSQFQFWLIALLIGIAAGFAALFFRKGITALQGWVYGAEDVDYLHSFAQDLPWYLLLAIPTVGGLIVGLILHYFTPDGRVRSVADVIEGAAMRNGRVELREGLGSAMASFLTLSTGGSTGREGPVVHLAGVISSWVSDRIKADGITGRDLLGCAVAAAVSASFNAPIAGALFALEVVLRHFAVHAFAPIVIAAVAGTVINRLEYGDVTEFTLNTPGALQFYVELPAFLVLGLVCGLVAVILMRSIFWADNLGNEVQSALSIPRWLRPAISGAMLGGIAIWFPHIIGVGYETTVLALTGGLVLSQAILFTMVKTAAVAITMGGRMGGGVFSPSLMIGAMTGLAFGLIATSILPEVSGTHTLYAFAGMGAVAAAVLGAPISTTLIVFELTGDWQIGLAVMVAVSLSTALASRLVDRSFFLTQLEKRNLHCAAGPQAYLMALLSVGGLMRPINDPRGAAQDECKALIEQGLYLRPEQSLEAALPVFDRADVPFLPVVAQVPQGSPAVSQGAGEQAADGLLGALYHVDALKAYNRALVATAAEEHS